MPLTQVKSRLCANAVASECVNLARRLDHPPTIRRWGTGAATEILAVVVRKSPPVAASVRLIHRQRTKDQPCPRGITGAVGVLNWEAFPSRRLWGGAAAVSKPLGPPQSARDACCVWPPATGPTKPAGETAVWDQRVPRQSVSPFAKWLLPCHRIPRAKTSCLSVSMYDAALASNRRTQPVADSHFGLPW